MAELSDVNGDGILDLTVSFSTSALNLSPGAQTLRLTGSFASELGDQSFELTGTVNVIKSSKGRKK